LASILGLGLVFALLAHAQHNWTWQRCALLPLLIALALIMVLDLRSRIIPDVITLPGIAYALLLAAGFRGAAGFIEGGLGALAGGAMVLLFAIVSRGGIGGGDIKLTAMLGAALGWKGAFVAFALSQIAAGLVALILVFVHRWRQPMPVGAFIALFGALILVSRP
jgi:leader peptidase (prepilin peptidase) / N-methyltransferase